MSFEDHLPFIEPEQLVAGETGQWKRRWPDFSAAAGWALNYYFRGPGAALDVTAAANGADFVVTVTSTQSAGLTAGVYFWQAWVVLGSVKHLVGEGQITIKQGFAATADPFDGRSPVKKILDAIDALVLGKATLDQQEYTIGTRSLKRIPVAELLALRTQYAQLYAREQRAARLRAGGPFFKNIYTRFTDPC